MPTVIVSGLPQIQRDLEKAGTGVHKAFHNGLVHAAEPVAHTAEVLAVANIRNMHKSLQWRETRIGVRREAVYVVPKQRGVKGRGPDPRRRPFAATKTGGPSFGELMLGRAFVPALDVMTPIVEQRVNILIREVLRSSRALVTA